MIGCSLIKTDFVSLPERASKWPICIGSGGGLEDDKVVAEVEVDSRSGIADMEIGNEQSFVKFVASFWPLSLSQLYVDSE